jgi:RHS repeat-associated protein
MTTATRENDNTVTPGIRSQRMQYRYDQLQRLKKQEAFDWNGSSYVGTTAYMMNLTYDAGGNILTMTRNGDASLLDMDNLSYVYNNNGKPNQLTQILDSHTTPTFDDDLETQPLDTNYRYDNIGNMTRDYSEGGKSVTWNVYNKITNVSINNGAQTLAFGYDASGNRVRKESTASSVTTKQWYVRDAQGNILSVYKQVGSGTLRQEYTYLYGSTRVGEYLLNRDSVAPWNRHYYRVKGNRHYELTNHLGNVLAVVTDRKIAKDTTADATYTPQFFMPDVYSVQNYYAFGQNMPKWSGVASVNDPKKYKFGYNGKEDDDEWGKQDYGFRISDPRIGRFLSVDPIASQYPWYTPYQFAGNMPIWASDLDGLEPNKETGHINANVVFSQGENSTMSQSEFEEMACAFETNCINVWNGLEYNGNQVDITAGSTFTTNENDPTLVSGIWNFNVVFDNFNGPSYANQDTRTIHINENTFNDDGDVAAHEYGHLLGLSDRYVDGGTFPTYSNPMDRVTLPITSPIDSNDPDYDYLNNLYSNGSALVTPYQLDIVFNMERERNWSMGYRWFAHTKKVVDSSWGSQSPLFDGVSVDKFEFSFRYQPVGRASQLTLKTYMSDGNLGFFDRNFTRSSQGLSKRKNHTYLRTIHNSTWSQR